MFWKFILVVLIACAVGLVAYAMYLAAKMHSGRGRFAATVVGALLAVVPATVLSLSQVQVAETVISVFDYFRTGQWISRETDGWNRLIDYCFIFALSYITIQSILRFSSKILLNWEGPTTTVDAKVQDKGYSDELFPLAITFIQFRLSGTVDLPVDPKTLQSQFLLSPLPKEPIEWIDLSRELLLGANNEIVIGDASEGWSDEIDAWVGRFVPKYGSGNTETVIAGNYPPLRRQAAF